MRNAPLETYSRQAHLFVSQGQTCPIRGFWTPTVPLENLRGIFAGCLCPARAVAEGRDLHSAIGRAYVHDL